MEAHPYNGILLGNKKEQTTHTCNNVDEFQMHVAKWKKPDSIDFIYMILRKRQNNKDRKQIKGCQKLGVGWIDYQVWENLWGVGTVLISW